MKLGASNRSLMRYQFKCPTCRKSFVYDQPGEPMCTGPSETSDDHEPTVMRLAMVGLDLVDPIMAERRSIGPLMII